MTVGYVSGVFDMFHIGHLNIIMQARQHCDQLIVGAVTDEVVERVKGRSPIVPLDERMQILSGLRDVDRVVVDAHEDKFDTWRELRYDVLFKGDDWQETPKGVKLEQDLAGVGARIVYFPYTRHTSSSLLRQVVTGLAHVPVLPLPEEPNGAPRGDQPSIEADHCPLCGGKSPGLTDEPRGLTERRLAAPQVATMPGAC